jgi:hypothetical protein
MTAIIEIFFQKFLTQGESNLRTWDAFRCYCNKVFVVYLLLFENGHLHAFRSELNRAILDLFLINRERNITVLNNGF